MAEAVKDPEEGGGGGEPTLVEQARDVARGWGPAPRQFLQGGRALGAEVTRAGRGPSERYDGIGPGKSFEDFEEEMGWIEDHAEEWSAALEEGLRQRYQELTGRACPYDFSDPRDRWLQLGLFRRDVARLEDKGRLRGREIRGLDKDRGEVDLSLMVGTSFDVERLKYLWRHSRTILTLEIGGGYGDHKLIFVGVGEDKRDCEIVVPLWELRRHFNDEIARVREMGGNTGRMATFSDLDEDEVSEKRLANEVKGFVGRIRMDSREFSGEYEIVKASEKLVMLRPNLTKVGDRERRRDAGKFVEVWTSREVVVERMIVVTGGGGGASGVRLEYFEGGRRKQVTLTYGVMEAMFEGGLKDKGKLKSLGIGPKVTYNKVAGLGSRMIIKGRSHPGLMVDVMTWEEIGALDRLVGKIEQRGRGKSVGVEGKRRGRVGGNELNIRGGEAEKGQPSVEVRVPAPAVSRDRKVPVPETRGRGDQVWEVDYGSDRIRNNQLRKAMDRFVLAWLGKLGDWNGSPVAGVTVVVDESGSGEKWVSQLRITNREGRYAFVSAEAFALGMGFKYESKEIGGKRRMAVMKISGPNGLFFEISPNSSIEGLGGAMRKIGIRDKSGEGGKAVVLGDGVMVVKEERVGGKMAEDRGETAELRLEPA